MLIAALAFASLILAARRAEIARTGAALASRTKAKASGSHRARLQYPHVDLSRCLGCGTCIAACPEEGVLELAHGQAIVAHGARCVGHGRCAAECPVGAISVTLGDVSERRDIPAITSSFESTRVRGLFLAGEVTGYALIRTAIAHGTAVADEVAKRVAARSGSSSKHADVLDLCVVGAGPAGLACSLEAKKRGLRFVTLEQADLGGTVAQYPRRKLVMTQPVALPLHGTLSRTSYSKEELMDLWSDVSARHQLPIQTGAVFQRIETLPDGTFAVHASGRLHLARNVCLALGRRGTPRKLGVPGEELPKVAYGLLDAHSYQGRRILVVGGGDSAIEAALGLAEQSGNRVSLSYRKASFSRLRARNEARLMQAMQRGDLEVLFESEVARIEPDVVLLKVRADEERVLANDDVFVFAGGVAPQELLEAAGVSFDPADRPPAVSLSDQGPGLLRALAAALVLALGVLAWTAFFADYYRLEPHERPGAAQHEWLRPSGAVGLAFGIGAAVLIASNLAYLVRRSRRGARIPGSLQAWMTSHVATGIGALLFVLVHSAMAPGHTVGGHAFVALAILVVTGAIGRYFYSFVPRAANGSELVLEEVRSNLAALSSEWDRGNRAFAQRVRAEIDRLVAEGQWQGSFARRLVALLASQRRVSSTLARLREEAIAEGLPPAEIRSLLSLARRAQRTALMAAHYEDLRMILTSWRYFHRWVALAMVLLAGLHVAIALRYGSLAG
jgi:thioredoxin reductase/Pyruvate/2-oxoacid:ferredoxin oxidoreductase delta subunit